MKFTIPRNSLIAALTVVKDAAGKSTLPILCNVLVKAYEKSVSFTSTDLDITLRTSADAFVSDKGEITVRCDLLLNLAKSFTGPADVTVLLETGKDHVHITSERSKYKLGTLDAEEFPQAVKLESPVEFKLIQARLRSLLASTHFCASTDEGRYILNSSYLQLNGDLKVISTDGRRIAYVTDELEGKFPETEIIIPNRTVDQLLRLLDKEDDTKTVRIIAATNAVQFHFSDTVITSRIIEGKYPDYRQVLPNDAAMKEMVEVPIDRVLLLEALQRVQFISDTCLLEFKGQMLTIRAQSEKSDVVGDCVETLLIPKTRPLSIRFHVRSLIEILGAVTDDQVTFHALDDSHPGVFRVPSSNWRVVSTVIREPEKK